MSILLIFGAGGHGRVVADAAVRAGCWSRVVGSDRDPARCTGELLSGVAICSPDSALSATAVHVAIGDSVGRENEVNAVAGGNLVSVIHPQSSVSAHARLSAGCFVAAQAVVAPGARLGLSVIVNHGAVVDHDVEVGDFSHVAPHAALGGAARIGKRVLVGSGARVLPGLAIGDDVVIGAGAVVCGNLLQPGVYAGVPARRLR